MKERGSQNIDSIGPKVTDKNLAESDLGGKFSRHANLFCFLGFLILTTEIDPHNI